MQHFEQHFRLQVFVCRLTNHTQTEKYLEELFRDVGRSDLL